ncbi:MAG: sigma-54-dependent Fis family transcriptional regulator [Gemmatimonadota bacterium]|nr:MAG: sigma-54-dependent Fis family transcriptional regulator [Gemmatimonadota bacterium]
MAFKSVLVIDDEESMCDFLRIMLEREGFTVQMETDGRKAFEVVGGKRFDVVITDIRMPGTHGLEILQRVKEIDRTVPVIVMTAYGTKEAAIEALNAGASFFIEKPFKKRELMAYVDRVLEVSGLRRENRLLREWVGGNGGLDRLIGSSSQMESVREHIVRVAPSDSTVLIRGESGTGKELVASAIHHNSLRCEGPFVRANVAAFSEGLVESELFGHERGAFTDAKERRIGRFEMANGGTLFIDEVGDISLRVQTKLLRVIEERRFERVGGTETLQVDVRLIAATNRDLERAVQEGQFREDLYYRLNVIPTVIPPLRERGGDVELLVNYFLDREKERNEGEAVRVSKGAMRFLTEYDWPGNVRELENVVERAVLLCDNGTITPEHLPETVRNPKLKPMAFVDDTFLPTMETIEKAYIYWVLQANKWRKQKAAEMLGIDPSTLHRKIERYQYSRDEMD